MLKTIIGKARSSKLMKKLAGGPQSILPNSPVKGSGIKGVKGRSPKKQKKYVVNKQNPATSPRTGGLVRPGRLK